MVDSKYHAPRDLIFRCSARVSLLPFHQIEILRSHWGANATKAQSSLSDASAFAVLDAIVRIEIASDGCYGEDVFLATRTHHSTPGDRSTVMHTGPLERFCATESLPPPCSRYKITSPGYEQFGRCHPRCMYY
jgi:hypothetical protein